MSDWTRPSTHPVPRVWRRLPGFTIQDLPPGREDEALELMTKFFMRDEPVCKALGILNDKECVKEYVSLLREACLPHHLSLVCIDDSNNKLAAVNFSRVVISKDAQEQVEVYEKLQQKYKSEQIIKILELCKRLYQNCDPFKKFGANTLLNSLGLSVDPAYRKHNLGTEMIWARLDMANQLGIPASDCLFTGIYSQRIATKVGLETLFEIAYDDFLNPDGTRVIPGDTSPHMSAKLMGGRIPKYIPPPPKA